MTTDRTGFLPDVNTSVSFSDGAVLAVITREIRSDSKSGYYYGLVNRPRMLSVASDGSLTVTSSKDDETIVIPGDAKPELVMLIISRDHILSDPAEIKTFLDTKSDLSADDRSTRSKASPSNPSAKVAAIRSWFASQKEG